MEGKLQGEKSDTKEKPFDDTNASEILTKCGSLNVQCGCTLNPFCYGYILLYIKKLYEM